MGSLREIKSKISSVKSTQQITSAMQMVSTVKLSRAERIIENFRPYQQKLIELLSNFLSTESKDAQPSAFEEERKANKVAIVVFSGNMSLCGAFNSNVAKAFKETINELSHLPQENIDVYSIGKKITHEVRKLGIEPTFESEALADKPTYEATIELAEELMNRFTNKELDQVIVIYHHFRSKGSQELTTETFLPFSFDEFKKEENEENKEDMIDKEYIDYIIEPNKATITSELIPQVIKLQLYTYLLESYTSEHAARSIAMQGATDNADDLLEELSLKYNKSRQESITSELLDIIGATFQ